MITLLPKGTKDKKSLKNWRPITLLSTLYKIISGVIGNRFKQFLPKIIAGNLLKLIELGRGARQGDPIASILFVLSIEILLIAIRKTRKLNLTYLNVL